MSASKTVKLFQTVTSRHWPLIEVRCPVKFVEKALVFKGVPTESEQKIEYSSRTANPALIKPFH